MNGQQQNNYQQTPQTQPSPSQRVSSVPPSKSGIAIAGFILGLIAILTSFIPIVNNFSMLLAVLGLIFGIVGLVGISRGKKSGKGLAIAAIVICVVSGAIVVGTQSMFSAALDEATSATTTNVTSSSNQDSSSSSPTSMASDSGVSAEYKNALAKAQTYSDTMHMSKQGIYDQLTSEYGEKFPADAAQYAIDNIKADWNANALAKAKMYQNQMNMSASAIHDQLTSEYGEQFTADEADYAIANL